MSSHVTSNSHLDGAIDTRYTFHPASPDRPGRAPYAAVTVDDITLFVNEPGQAQQLADLFADVADAFGVDPVRTYVLRRAREAVAEFRAWTAEPATGTGEDGHPRQYRYAEFAGRLATLVDELTDTPEAVATPDAIRPLFDATREQLERLVAAGDADAIAEDKHRRGDAR